MSRHRARETALKILFSFDLSHQKDTIRNFIDNYWDNVISKEDNKLGEEERAFTKALLEGTVLYLEILDKIIKERLADTWRWERIAPIDKNILRLSLYELLFMEDIPVAVTINEAIEMAKKYGDKNSYRFVNGLLNKVKEELDKPSRTWIELA
jgi:N utilization substance protein B